MKNLNVQKRNFFQNVLKRSQKINVNVQNSNVIVTLINQRQVHDYDHASRTQLSL